MVEFDTPYNLIQREDDIFRSVRMKGGTFSESEAALRRRRNQERDGCVYCIHIQAATYNKSCTYAHRDTLSDSDHGGLL